MSLPWLLLFDVPPPTSESIAVDQARVGLRAMGPGTASLAKKATTLRFTTLYHIVAYGGEREFWITTHTEPILFESNTYQPASVADSARRGETGGSVPNSDITAAIDSSLISEDELLRQIYGDCVVNQVVVDYRYPWAGAFERFTRYVESIEHNSEVFTARLVGKTAKLRDKAGYTFTRPCPAAVGDSDCGFDLSTPGYTQTGAEVQAVASARSFSMDPGTVDTQEDEFYTWGQVIWTLGNNKGHISVVRSYTNGTRAFTLIDDTPFPIVDGNQATLVAGCDGLRLTCKTKFIDSEGNDNFPNYQGHPFLIGADRQFNTPS